MIKPVAFQEIDSQDITFCEDCRSVIWVYWKAPTATERIRKGYVDQRMTKCGLCYFKRRKEGNGVLSHL